MDIWNKGDVNSMLCSHRKHVRGALGVCKEKEKAIFSRTSYIGAENYWYPQFPGIQILVWYSDPGFLEGLLVGISFVPLFPRGKSFWVWWGHDTIILGELHIPDFKQPPNIKSIEPKGPILWPWTRHHQWPFSVYYGGGGESNRYVGLRISSHRISITSYC